MNKIPPTYQINQCSSAEEVLHLRFSWAQSLSGPQDGMWEAIRAQSDHWTIRRGEAVIGYACIDENKQLLQFYLLPEYRHDSVRIFGDFIRSERISVGIVGTNNPVYLTTALHFTRAFEIHTYLFQQHYDVAVEEKNGNFRVGAEEDQERIVEFCQLSTGAPADWLNSYVGNLLAKGELFILENAGNIIGTCEVRKSSTHPAFADIGMIVTPQYRRKGYGTFLLHRAKNIAKEWGRTPICSCEKSNVGSQKAIHHCGFISTAQLLKVDF